MQTAAKLLIVPVVIYAVIVLAFFLGQRRLQYHPSNDHLRPEAVGLTGVSVEEVLTADRERLVLWYAASAPEHATVLLLHGNGGEIGGRPRRFAFYQSRGLGAAFLSYRGYGGSTGAPTEAGLIADAEAAYDWLIAKGVRPDRIVLAGESLGSGVAVQLAARRKVAAVALEAAFSSAADVGAWHYPWLPVRALMFDQFRSIDVVGGIKAPLIFFHGDRDQVVPYELGQRLFAAAPEPKEFVTLPGGDHFSIFDEDVWHREAEFFDRVLAIESRRGTDAAAAH